MSSVRAFTVELPVEVADAMEDKVRSGAYASVDEVVHEGVRALLDHEVAEERWLRNDVVESCREMAADPSRAIPLEDIMPRLRVRRAKAPT